MDRAQVNIFNYNDYRRFLADFYDSKKSANSSYSHRMFANKAGLSSPSYLLMTIKGERNISIKTMPKFIKGLGLSSKEQRYFELLVHYNQTNELHEKARYFSELISLKANQAKLHDLEKERYEFLANWYVVAIYVLIEIDGFSEDLDWIYKRLGGKVSKTHIKQAMQNLEKLGFIEKSPTGEIKQTSGALTVADDTRSMAVFNYHQSMIRLAQQALNRCQIQQREMNGATIAISKEKLPELKEKIRQFRKEINQFASSLENPDEVYQMNIQLFPLTSMEEE